MLYPTLGELKNSNQPVEKRIHDSMLDEEYDDGFIYEDKDGNDDSDSSRKLAVQEAANKSKEAIQEANVRVS